MENDNDPVVSPEEAGHGAGDGPVVPHADWDAISYFQVKCKERENVTAKVYSNRYQYVVITVDITATKGGEEVVLSQGQLDSIELIRFVGGDKIMHPLRVYHSKPNQYINEFGVSGSGAEGDVEDGDLQNGVQRKTFYIVAYDNNTDSHKIAARIISPAGVAYTTNTLDPTPGKFNSYVIVECVHPIVHNRNSVHFTFERQESQGALDGYIYSGYFIDARYHVVRVEPYFTDPVYFWTGHVRGWSRYFSMHPTPGAATRTFHDYTSCAYTFKNIPQNAIVALHIDTEYHNQWSRDIPGAFKVFDQYGNWFSLEWYLLRDGGELALRDK